MHLELLVEDRSTEVALTILVPRIVTPEVECFIHPFNGKQDLLGNLPGRLKGYASWLPEDWRIGVLVDRDDDDCKELKDELEVAADEADLFTRSTAKAGGVIQVFNRIAIEELEAWFFGDPPAIARAYPRVKSNLGKQTPYRNPDAIKGGTWEALERVLQKVGYYKTGLPKIEVARNIAEYMDPERNSSHSFQVFRDTLRML